MTVIKWLIKCILFLNSYSNIYILLACDTLIWKVPSMLLSIVTGTQNMKAIMIAFILENEFFCYMHKHTLKNIFLLFDVKYYFSGSLSCRSLWWQRSLLTSEDWYFLKRLLWFHICVHMMENECYVYGYYVWRSYLSLSDYI